MTVRRLWLPSYRHGLICKAVKLTVAGKNELTRMKRPPFHPIPLADVTFTRGSLTFTMSQGQWDALLAAAYERGATLLELDVNERPVAAYRLCQCDLCASQRN